MADDSYERIMAGPVPDGPLFPDGAGEILHAILNPAPRPGPPWVHTIEPPRCDLEDCCETDEPCGCACHRVQPTHTITEGGDPA